jgi:hypothetical protein
MEVGDADKSALVIVASRFRQASLEMNVAQYDGEQHHAPRNTDRMIVATVATCLAQTVEQGGVGDGGEQAFDGAQGRAVFEGVLGERIPRSSEPGKRNRLVGSERVKQLESPHAPLTVRI